MQTHDTLTKAPGGLRQQDFTLDYILKSGTLRCQQYDLELHPGDFTIAGPTHQRPHDPDDESVLYTIEGKDGQRRTLVDAYDTYAEAIAPELTEKLTVHGQNMTNFSALKTLLRQQYAC